MRDMKKGRVVISKSGRDKGRSFVVFEIDDRYVWLADGKLRKIEAPKKKNIKHLQQTNMFIEIESITGNKSLNKRLLQLRGEQVDL